jgi:hypothetical protein
MTDTLSVSSAITWGATLSAAIESLFPAIAIAVRAGVEYDPTLLVHQLCEANPDDPAAWALRSMLQVTDTALEHAVYERNVAQEQLQLRQTELQNCQSDLRKKSDLCDILSTRLASLISQPVQPLLQPSASYPKRLSKDPLPFDGEEKEIKRRQQGYINWKSQLRLCFAQDSALFNTEKIKILHTVGLLRGDAYNNNRAIFDYMTSHPDDVSRWTCTTSNTLFAALDRQYETLDLKLDAGIDFDKLFQRKMPFPNFIAMFETLAYQSGKTDEQKVDALKRKISQELAEKLATLENPPAANDYLSWVKKCRTFYENIRVYEHNQSYKTGLYRPRPTNDLPTALPSPQGDLIQLDRASLNRISSENREYCWANNLCFYCKEQGHSIENCKRKAVADSRTADRGSRRNFFSRANIGASGRYSGRGLAGHGQNAQQTLQQFQKFRPLNPSQSPRSYFASRPQLGRLRSIEHDSIETSRLSAFPTPSDSTSQVQNQQPLSESGNV